jgi:hypothetical protein
LAKAVVQKYKLSRTFNAPLDFVFQWCTDFREDDNKMVDSKTRRTFLEKGKNRIVWVVNYKEDGKEKEGIRAVWLQPPNGWHLDTCGDGREVGDYRLKSMGKNKTRLDMVFYQTFDSKEEVENPEEWEKDSTKHWATYADYLEKDYAKSK